MMNGSWYVRSNFVLGDFFFFFSSSTKLFFQTFQAQEFLGTKTYLRKHNESNHMFVRVDGELHDTSVLHCLAVWRESDLYRLWIPMCSTSTQVHCFTDVEFVARAAFKIPMFSRDMVIHGYGIDLTGE
jgi:hypothetical protein